MMEKEDCGGPLASLDEGMRCIDVDRAISCASSKVSSSSSGLPIWCCRCRWMPACCCCGCCESAELSMTEGSDPDEGPPTSMRRRGTGETIMLARLSIWADTCASDDALSASAICADGLPLLDAKEDEDVMMGPAPGFVQALLDDGTPGSGSRVYDESGLACVLPVGDTPAPGSCGSSLRRRCCCCLRAGGAASLDEAAADAE